MPPNQSLDTDLILAGYQGELFDQNGNLLAQVNRFEARLNLTNSDYRPAGQMLEVAIPQSYRVTLVFTETVINDTQFLGPVVSAIIARRQPKFTFQGILTRNDGKVGQYLFQECVPDGDITLFNVAPGEVIERAWNWRVNQPPNIQTLLGT